MEPQLTPDTFLAIAEMVAAQLRIKEADPLVTPDLPAEVHLIHL